MTHSSFMAGDLMNTATVTNRPLQADFLLIALGSVLVISIPLAIWQIALPGIDESTALLYTRYTARVSFLFFLPVFTGKALQVLLPGPITSQLVRRRRHLGLAFALAHGIHMGAIILLYVTQDRWFTLDDGAALFIYLMLGLMVITSNTFSVRRLGRGWKWLHKFGMYALFVGFFATYLGRVVEYDAQIENDSVAEYFWVYVLLLTTVSCGWLLRIAAYWKPRLRG
ncbi:MAG: sulfoxide reductase heme-binding subunit YedZ [Patiriisocius sp.]|jgi:sulfoxide reductase heme-binding subunit YedZ